MLLPLQRYLVLEMDDVEGINFIETSQFDLLYFGVYLKKLFISYLGVRILKC